MLNGYEVCQAVKADHQMGSTSVLLLVGTHEAFDETRSQSVKADGYIIKPFKIETLIARIEEASSAN